MKIESIKDCEVVLPNKIKEKLLPLVGSHIRITDKDGNYTSYRVTFVNIGKLRFSCELTGVFLKNQKE